MDAELAAQGRASGATQAAFRAAQAAVAEAYAETPHARRQAAVSAANGEDADAPGLAPAFARFPFEEPDPSDPDWQPDSWTLFVDSDSRLAGADYVRRRDELLTEIITLREAAASDARLSPLYTTPDD